MPALRPGARLPGCRRLPPRRHSSDLCFNARSLSRLSWRIDVGHPEGWRWRRVPAVAEAQPDFITRLSCSSGHRQLCRQTPPLGQLQEIVDGADDGPFAAHLFEAAQQELTETTCLF